MIPQIGDTTTFKFLRLKLISTKNIILELYYNNHFFDTFNNLPFYLYASVFAFFSSYFARYSGVMRANFSRSS